MRTVHPWEVVDYYRIILEGGASFFWLPRIIFFQTLYVLSNLFNVKLVVFFRKITCNLFQMVTSRLFVTILWVRGGKGKVSHKEESRVIGECNS